MKRNVTYCLLLFISTFAASQPADWTFVSTQKPKTFYFTKNNLFLINGQSESPSAGDYVGIFTQINKVEKCVGYTVIANDTANFLVTAYGRNTPTDTVGYIYNSTFRIRWWNKIKQCQVSVDYTDSIYRLDSNATYTSIQKVSTSLPFVSYSKNSYNIAIDSNPSPTFSSILTDIRFSSSYSQLQIDSISGTISLKYSIAGHYQIKISSQYCLQNDSLNITLKDSVPIDTSKKPPVLRNLTFSVLSPGCKTLGSISFKESTISGVRPFTFHLSAIYYNESYTNTSGQFNDLREGIYQLSVTDSIGLESIYPKSISLVKTEDCSNTILAPNAKDGLQAIFIPEQGNAKILDREGNIIKQLNIPAEWDGRDFKGNYVPMGDYYLFINEHQEKVITVIR